MIVYDLMMVGWARMSYFRMSYFYRKIKFFNSYLMLREFMLQNKARKLDNKLQLIF